nr:ribonuclease H-like domain-containing protein [Tanacetum cinerariifolium]
MNAMTLKMDAQNKELQYNAKKANPDLDEDDIPMSREEEAKFMQTFYFQIPIDPNDQEKTTLTCPFDIDAYKRMPFGLCNAPATFQRKGTKNAAIDYLSRIQNDELSDDSEVNDNFLKETLMEFNTKDGPCSEMLLQKAFENGALIGSENYKMWSTAMKIALTGKNKMGFIDGTCVKPVTSPVLAQQWEICNDIVLGWILGSLSQELYLGQVYSEIASESNLLARIPLPDVKDAFVVSREESHRGLAPGKTSAKSNHAAFLLKLTMSGFVNKFSGNNVDMSQNASTYSSSMSASFTNEQMVKLLSLINEKPAANVFDSMAGNMPCFFNNSTYFNLNIEKFYCVKSGSYVYNVTLGWIIDSGANQHMTTSTKNMFNVVDISSLKLSIGHPNGTMANIIAIGSMRFTENVVLFDVLIIPEYTVNLLSVNKMIKDSKYFVGFDESKCYIQDLKLGKIVGTGSESVGLCMFYYDHNGKTFAGMSNSGIVSYVFKELWHCRLGHPTDQVLSVLSGKIGYKNGDHTSACDICHKAKQTREPFPLSDHKSFRIGDLIHLDVCGPYKATSRDGYKYFLTIVDDFSRAVLVYLLKTKAEVFENIENFIKMVFTQFEIKVKVIKSDNGIEFVNNKMSGLLTSLGIIHQTSRSYTPQQNGIVERKHRHLLNVSRSLMFQGRIPLSMWPECVLTTAYLINRLPSSVLSGASPFKIVYVDWFNFFDTKSSQSPNDEDGDSSTEDGKARASPIQNERVVPLATQKEDNVTFEGNNLSFSIGGSSGLRDSHFSARLRVLRYLKQAPGTRAQFNEGNEFRLHAFLDADWAKLLEN